MAEYKIPKLVISGITDEGLVRDHNEDYISCLPELGLVTLADGMGGHNAGEVASKLAVTNILESLTELTIPSLEAVTQSVVSANNKVNEHARKYPECAGMGTTIVMALFHDESVILASVGDSRIYRFRKGELKQLSTDHSLVQEMIDSGYMTKEEALESNNRNLITRALGVADEVQVDVAEHEVEKNDIYLLCSDGLSDMVDDKNIFSTLVKTRDNLERAGKDLVGLAKKNGGKDNISVILVACK